MLWHYTVRHADHLGSIFRDQAIRPNLKRPFPAVWFSADQWFDPSCRKTTAAGTLMAVDEALPVAARIGIEHTDALLSWEDFRRRVPFHFKLTVDDRDEADRLLQATEDAGRAMGSNPDEWFASLEPVPGSVWRAVQTHANGRWTGDGFNRKADRPIKPGTTGGDQV